MLDSGPRARSRIADAQSKLSGGIGDMITWVLGEVPGTQSPQGRTSTSEVQDRLTPSQLFLFV